MIDFSKIQGFIFDNDGVIVNSEPLSCQSLRQLLIEEFKIDIGHDFSDVIGTSDKYAIHYYLSEQGIGLPENVDTLIDRKAEIYFDLAENSLQPFDHFHELITYLQHNFQLAIASSGNHDKINFSLDQIGASQYFPIICSATEVENGKPAPDLFEFTAECMGVPPHRCVVIEDSTNGIHGAKSAGMNSIGFTSSFSAMELKEAGADLIINDFKQLQNKIKADILR